MGRARHHGLVLALVTAACAVDGVEVDLAGLEGRAEEGIARIERGLEQPSRALGEGVEMVEDAVRALAAVETDPRATPQQRLLAVLLQARAWDGAARAIAGAGRGATLDPAQASLLAQILDEKAFPYRVAAENSYQRALRDACTLGPGRGALWVEIADGVERYGGVAASCPRH